MGATCVNKPVSMLAVTDVFPDAADSSSWLTQILRNVSRKGNLTLLVRDARHTGHYEAAWRDLGLQICAGDNERLAALGVETPDFQSPLPQLLEQGRFSAVILMQNFSRGISIPEHYLDDIRKHAPQSRIAVLSEELYAQGALHRAELSGQHDHYEVAQDWSDREWGGFERADLIIVSHAQDAARLFEREPLLPVAVVPHAMKRRSLAAGWSSRHGILFFLDLKRPADVDSFVWFIEKGWPVVRQRAPEVELLIVGGEEVPLESRKKLPGVKWFPAGELERVAESARLFISPLRFGASRSPLSRLVASGLPGVACSFAVGAAGLPAESGVLSADTAEECAHAAIRLHEGRKLWETLAHKQEVFIRERHSPELQSGQLASALDQLAGVIPKPVCAAPFSMMLVESACSEVLRRATARQRIPLRLDFHVQIAQELLRAGKPWEAREQLRHVYSWLGESNKPELPLARLLSLLARCYRELDERTMALRCADEARRCFAKQAPPASRNTPIPQAKRTPAISLIVPTFNRLPILKKCLAALEGQTVPPRDFEVIVIDDGSSDGTEAFLGSYQPKFRLQYLRQPNSGTGAARRNGVAQAAGEYLLLMNDDTICEPDVIEQHLGMQRKYAAERWAILGNFEYPREARHRAMTHFLHEGSFMFPQVDMEEGFPYPYSHFITCNLSVRRDAVLAAGSFDPVYKLSEDTELGIRLFEMGYGVLYHPAAHAWHDHLPYTVSNLIRRARVYGADYFYMFRRHPRVVREWGMPISLAGLDASTAGRIQTYLSENRQTVDAAVAALTRWDSVEFDPILENPKEVAQVLALFQQAVPAIHWFYLFESMLETMGRELGVSAAAPKMRLVMKAQSGSQL